jgi:hypothetical protein
MTRKTRGAPVLKSPGLRRLAISRRAMLRGMLGGAAVTIGLPALDIFLNDSGTAYADCGTGIPARFGIFYFGNGMIPAQWNPTRTGPDYDLPPMLSLLEPVKQHVTVVSGMRVLTTNTSPHLSGPAGLFSGADLVDDTFVGPSIDQVVAAEQATRFQSIEVGIERSTNSWSMTGPHMVNPPETNPRALFDRIFGGGFTLPGEGVTDPRIGLRISVLDAVTDQTARLESRLGYADRQRLDQHLEGIRQLETQLSAPPPDNALCMRPVSPDAEYPDIDGRPQMQAIHRAMSDLLVMAFTCDQTRVFLEMFTQPVNNTLFLDTEAGHHSLTHDEPGDQPQVGRIVQFIVGEYAYLVNRLATTVEGAGTLLDSCAILGTTDVSYGRTHALDEYPILIAGSACDRLVPGVHYRSLASENASKVCLTLLDAVGVTRESYGTGAARTTDRLLDITGPG